MRKLLWPLGLAATLFSPFFSHAQTSNAPLTLAGTLERVLAYSPGISAALHEVEATQGAIQQAGALRNPTFSTVVEDTRRDTRTTTATLDFVLELGGQRGARVNVATRASEIAQAQLSHARAQARASAIAGYFTMLLAQERSKLAANSAELAARGAEAVARRVAAGKVSPVDAMRARVDAANAGLEWAQAQAELQGARQALAALWGESAPVDFAVEGDVTAVPSRDSVAALALELEDAPMLRAGRLEAERRRAQVEVERGKALPDVTLSVGAKRDNEAGRTQAVIGLSMPLPVFDRNQGAVSEAGKRAQQADDELALLRTRALTELQQAASQLALARSSLQVLMGAVLPAAQEALAAATQGFDAGKFGLIDVLDAQRSLLQARTRYLNTLATAYQAATAIDRVLGR
ncbi:TolC family protein [Roseateles koreensis]|uniref:TolC family protein n=1 Tax=Roseateles koreensis TaxID=2987526 RepID=A0ABT5KTN4_9BURK|nr:TolC family protein [Roseateles koreensis]MDC8785708.1 TolC family protein [Roseateles koreensis]